MSLLNSPITGSTNPRFTYTAFPSTPFFMAQLKLPCGASRPFRRTS